MKLIRNNNFYNGLGMESKLNGIEMKKFETKEELVEWIETMHLQNTNGRETEEEMFRLGIEAAIQELTEFNLFAIHGVVKSSYCEDGHHEVMKDNGYCGICNKKIGCVV